VDAAAVHHVFDGGWIWVLRFNNGVTSAGVAADSAIADELRFADGAPAWERLIARLPSVRDQFAEARATLPFVHTPRLAFRASVAVGPNWALMPSAAGFVDPLLSTGFPLTLLGVQRLGRILESLDEPGEKLKEYESKTLHEADRAARLVSALYRSMDRPPIFNALTLLYFAAASFTETAHRLKKPELAGNTFLLGDHATFAPAFNQCLELAL